ncbi:hypothetical protein E7T06_02695 [Deinococcus sp. Arct2-2]|uniref:hypothetical protein n=1 Tax=Deinococcus sp. Arct2-2 TaxID=2568653 RepID=UPI0010A3E654|nr:hypothetical protein [Deinococcus sp. Arct2-2]THF71542.1 hypothetical protein E7T06_02695 [Deinococcus sp. Arct2-2]
MIPAVNATALSGSPARRPQARTLLLTAVLALLPAAAAAAALQSDVLAFPLTAPTGDNLRGPVRELALAAAPDGSLVLAVMADSGTFNSGRGVFTARRLTAWRAESSGAALSWQPLGGSLNYDDPRPVSSLNLALDERGAPVLVWNENYGDNDIVVFRAFQNGAWTQWQPRYLGDDLPYAARTRAVAARNGEPVLAWGEWLRNPYGSRLTVRVWEESAKTWRRGPAFNDISAFSRTPALALNAAGLPTVAWLQGEVLDSNVFVKRWTGTAWEALGSSLNRRPNTYLASTRMVLNPQEQPVVAWLEDLDGEDALYVSAWSGSAWTALGGRLDTASASAPSLAVNRAGQPVAAWVEERGGVGRVRVARWQGGAWQDLGGRGGAVNLDIKRDARSPSVAVDAAGAVVLAWREDVGGVYRVQLRRFGP